MFSVTSTTTSLELCLVQTTPFPPIVVGSHIDTVVNGGKYDGAYGIVAGLEAARELKGDLQRPLKVVAFHDEEITMSGSLWVC